MTSAVARDGSDRTVPFDPQAKCDRCGKLGAYDFMGDCYCGPCLTGKKSSQHKYHAKATDGYPSKAQAERAQQLKLMERAGGIRNLREEVSFPLKIGGDLICTYRADFVYDEPCTVPSTWKPVWRNVVEDVKGVRTPVYRLKAKLMMAVYGIEIQEWPPKELRR